MKVLLSWLREFVDVPGSPEEIARTMSVRGFAVESIDPVEDAAKADPSAEASAKADAVLDFEITANRPDCMSVAGMAREVATAYGLALRDHPELASLVAVDRADIDILVERADLCPRYAGVVADVVVGPSPGWMQARLRAAGIRPISNVVDVTNYVLIEMGQPMHAFDLAKLAGAQIRVRTAGAGETLRTLDGETRTLSPDMLVIADAERAAAVAGVMGGSASEVAAGTSAIVLESAYFDPLSVRRTSKKLGLKTEASMRFERGADPSLPFAAMARAAALLERIGAGRARGTVVDRYPAPVRERTLRLRRTRLEGLLGAPIPDADVRHILESLGFVASEVPDGWALAIPTWRVDMVREVDLVEEVARHYGFDRLPVTFPALEAAPPPLAPHIVAARQVRTVLTAAGFSEAVTFGFVAQAAAGPFAPEGDLVPIANPLSENFAVLRPSALPALLDAAAHNRRRERRDIRLFEIGARFSRVSGERRAVACVWTGAAVAEHWSGATRDVDFFDIKGVAGRLCEAAGVESRMEPHQERWLVPGRAAAVLTNGTRVGVAGQLERSIAESHGLPGTDDIYVLEIDLDALQRAGAQRQIRVAPLPRYPSVTRDISVLIADALPAAEVRRTIFAAAPPTLVLVREFDRYQGKGIAADKISLSLRLTFRSTDRTLTDPEVQAAMDAIIRALLERHGAVQR